MIQEAVANWPNHQCRDSRLHRAKHTPLNQSPRIWEFLDFQKIIETSISQSLSFADVLDDAAKRCPSVTINPKRLSGVPCISGTRIPVHLVLWAIEQHGSIEGALESYPDLTPQQVKDALYFSKIVMGPHSVLDKTAPTA